MSADITPEPMPVIWDGQAEALQVSVGLLDEFGLPLERRAMRTKLPNNPVEFQQFADAVAVNVHTTVLHILNNRPGAFA